MSFQPFVVQCLTCGSQLRVTDPSIVGTIAACPKCHSMVQIEPPSQQVAVGTSAVDSQAITEEAIAAHEASEFGSSPPSTSGFAGDEAGGQSTAQPAGPVPPDWQSDRTRRFRQIAMVIAVSAVSLVVCIAGFSWFVFSWKDRQAVTQTDGGSTSEEVAELPQTSDEADPTDQDDASDDPAGIDPTADSRDSDASSATTMDPNQATSMAEPSAAVEGPAEPSSPASETASANNGNLNSTPTVPSDLIPRSPLDDSTPAVPPPPAAQLPVVDDSPAEQDPGTSGLQELPPELAKYTRFLLEEGPTEQPTLQAPPTMDEVTLEAAADELDDPTITVRPKEINLKADLALRMAVDTKGYRLPELVLLISQITGVPIQIDWVSFDLANIDLDAPVTTPQGWQSAREILDATAGQWGAELRDEETLGMITLSDEVFDQHLAALADLSDFGTGQASAKAVLIEFLGGEGQQPDAELPLGISREDRQLAGIAVDALRRMRQLDPKVEDDHLGRWAWPTSDTAGEWMPVVAGESLPQSDVPVAMAEFLRQLAKKNQVMLLINWYDFGRRSVAPERLFIPHSDVDAGETLRRALEPLGLQARQVDGNHWWLGRESTYDRLPVIVWTPKLGPQRDRFVQELTNVMQGATRDAFRLTIDPDTDRALILLPRFVVRQLSKLADGVATN